MLLESFEIDEMYLVRTAGTSDGTQDKFFKDDMWFSWTDMAVKELLKLLHLLSSNILDWIPMNLLNTIHA